MILLVLFTKLLSFFAIPNIPGELALPPDLIPVIECPGDKMKITSPQEYQAISGVLDNTDASFNAGLSYCWVEPINPQAGLHFFETCTFTVSEEDVYTFDLYVSGSEPGLDWMGGLIQDQGSLTPGFDLAFPCRDIISQNVDAFQTGAPFIMGPFQLNLGDEAPIWRITLPLKPGEQYTLVTTSIQAGVLGDFEWNVYSNDDGVLNGNCVSPVQETTETKSIICTDIDNIFIDNLDIDIPNCYRTDKDGHVIFPPNLEDRQKVEALLTWLANTGYPNADAESAMGGSVSNDCNYLEICVSDEIIENGDCGTVTIIRAFTVKDKQGNYIENSPCDGPVNTVTCEQVITIRKPGLNDIIFPPLEVLLDFDGDFEEDANGNPVPLATGFPLLRTAFGIQNLDQTNCNLGASYSDSPRVNICGNAYKILREWYLLDWCNPTDVYTYRQIVRVGGFTSLEIACSDTNGMPTYPTQPSDCTAAIEIPVPIISGGSMNNVTLYSSIVSLISSDVLDGNGEPTGETLTEEIVLAELESVAIDLADPPVTIGTVIGVPLGYYYFRYIVIDDCGNEVVSYCNFFVEDAEPPVPFCNEELDISLAGYFASIHTVEEFDNGSFDNCGLVKLEARRSYPVNSSTCESQLITFGPWQNFMFFNTCDIDEVITIELKVSDDRNQDGIPGNTILVSSPDGTSHLVQDSYAICQMEKTISGDLDLFEMLGEEDNVMDSRSVEDYRLFQNTPNPVLNRTNIGFQLPKEMMVRIRFHDITGKLLFLTQGQFSKGYNEITTDKSDLKARGIVFYTLETEDFVQTQKMVVLGE